MDKTFNNSPIFKGFILFVLIYLVSFKGWSHEIRPAYLQLIQVNDSTYHAYWKIPSMGEAVPKINPVFPNNFEVSILDQPNLLPGFALYSFILTSNEALPGKTIKIEGLNKTLIDALVTVEYLNGEKITLLLQRDKDSSVIPGKTNKWDVIKTYTVLGIEHIWFGIDHLLFVLALIIITSGTMKIIKTITAFTIAHSITLSLAVLGIVNFPPPPVEAVIALSIVFLAVEILNTQKGKPTITSKKPWLVAFIFGLLHGFGFAGALSNIGLPQHEIPLALAFFNVGVELGQIAFVLVVLIILKILARKKDWPLFVKKIPAYIIGSLAAFWFIERVVGFWN